MITIFLNKILFLFIIYSYGIIISKKILKIKYQFNFYEISLIGLIIILFLSQFINYFIPLNDYLLIINIIFFLIYNFFNKKVFFEGFKINYKIFILIFILSLLNIYGSGFSDDIDHYHYGSITNLDEHNLIWGYSFLHPLYGTMSLWLSGHSFLNFDNSRLQDIHTLNGIVFLLVTGLILDQLFNKKFKEDNFKPLLFSILIFIFFKYTRLKEFGLDRPAILIFCFLIFYYLKYVIFEKKNILENFIIISLISLAIISIKIIYLPVVFLPIIFFLIFSKQLFCIDSRYLIILFATFIFFSKSVLTSGCLVYPASFTCLNFIDWSDSLKIYNFAISQEVINKSWSSYSGELTNEIYIKNFNWLNTWFQRGKLEIFELLAITISISIITVFVYSFKFNNFSNDLKSLRIFIFYLILVIFSSLLLFFFKNPVIRMNHHLLISLNLIFVCLFSSLNEYKIKKKLFMFFLTLAILFNFSKNINRIHDKNYVNNPTFEISGKIHNKPYTHNLENFIYFQGWYGKAPIGNQVLKNRNYKKRFIFDIIY